MDRPDLVRRLTEYARRRRLRLGERLGSGVHGIVFAAESQDRCGWSALKSHESESAYVREREVYLHLRQAGIHSVLESEVPVLLDFDDELAVLEMTIVARPFVLDFAGAYLGHPPEFDEGVLADWWSEKAELFGTRWPDVQAILARLESHGIHMMDVNPGNISFAE